MVFQKNKSYHLKVKRIKFLKGSHRISNCDIKASSNTLMAWSMWRFLMFMHIFDSRIVVILQLLLDSETFLVVIPKAWLLNMILFSESRISCSWTSSKCPINWISQFSFKTVKRYKFSSIRRLNRRFAKWRNFIPN